MKTKTRFAPSPTGHIHIGNARTALINWLFAVRCGGRFLLRFDDTDSERSDEEFAKAIEADLRWLGIAPHETVRQSQRFALYDAAVEKLKSQGRLYPCHETPDELERKRRLQRARGKPPVYDRTALNLSPDDRAKLEAEGRKPHWRFKLNAGFVDWNDLVRGPQSIDADSMSDPVLVRADGTYLYMLPSVVDDIDLDVSHVIRGEDHVANTGVQIQMFEALGAAPPAFAHHNLLVGADGQGLSKRLGALSVGALREDGLEAMAVACHAATIGTSDPVAPHLSMEELASLFEFEKISRAPARFDEAELRMLNARLLKITPYETVADRLLSLGADGGEAFWNVARDNIDRLDEAKLWNDVTSGGVTPLIAAEDEEFCRAAAQSLPPEPWDETTWDSWTSALQTTSGRKGRTLYMPLRKALTGRERGPELAALLPLIGPEKVMERLDGKTG